MIPRINQADPTAPVYPTIRGPAIHVPRPRNPVLRHQTDTSSDEANYLGTQDQPLFCHLPETIYVSEGLPTRKPRELQAFKEHCRLQYEQSRATLVLEQPLNRLREYTTSPLNFQNLLWRSRTTVTYFGIFEEYHWIRRQTRAHVPDRAVLQPAYKVHYTWTDGGWTVTRLPRNHQ